MIFPAARALILVMLAALLVLGSCSSGGGMVRSEPRAAPGSGPGTDTDPVNDPEPSLPQRETCIPTHAGDCVPAADFEAAAEALAEEYRAHPNFQTQWGLRHVNAANAYGHVNQLMGADVAPGAGVTIGFIDTGIDQGHPAFAGKTIFEFLVGNAVNETGVSISHGTAVASVATAVRSLHEHSAHGVAWGADIAMFAIPLRAGAGDYVPITVAGLAGGASQFAALFHGVLAWPDGERRVDILNLSFGFDGIIDNYREQELRDSFGPAIAALAQADEEDKTILVWAAGNAHCDPALTAHCADNPLNAVSVEVLPGLVARIAELQGHSIAVVALRPDGTIADFSNRCGIAADHCIAAPGQEVRVAYLGPHPDTDVPSRGYGVLHGTSFAAPFASGALAVMKQLFRGQLSSTELVARLFETANSEGIYADRAVYGHGALDLRAATWPVGVLDVPVGESRVDGRGTALAATGLRAGAAFGDGFARSLSGREVAAFDTLGAPFWFDLGAFTVAAAARAAEAGQRAFIAHPSDAPEHAGGGFAGHYGRLQPLAPAPSPWRIGVLETPPLTAGGHLALADSALGLQVTDRRVLTGTAFTTEGGSGQAAVSGAALSWQPAHGPLGLHAGWLHERDSVLGSTGAGAFGALAGDTAFAGAAAQAALGEWRLRAGAELGVVHAAAHGGIVSEVAPLTTSSASVQASTPVADGGELRFSVAQPLRVEAGRAALAVPAGRTRAGDVVYHAMSADLEPSGRQVDVAAQWDGPVAAGELRVGAVVTLQPGHRAAAPPEVLVLGGWRWRY